MKHPTKLVRDMIGRNNTQLDKDLLSNMSDKEIYTKYPEIKNYGQLRNKYVEARRR